jgi:hypothetical protein
MKRKLAFTACLLFPILLELAAAAIAFQIGLAQ